MNDKKTVRAAIYARVSTTDQNPDPQLEELRQYVRQRGFILHKEYIDRVTGDFEKRKRKRKQQDLAYQELMQAVSKRLVDCVVVWKYDRFARSLSVLVSALQQFNSLGIDFISYTQQIDTTTPMGRLFYNVIGSFAEFEREMIVERVRAGLANAKAKGVRLGRPEKDKTAPERIAALRQEGWSLRQIAEREKLSAAGVLKILKRSNFQTPVDATKKPTVRKITVTLYLRIERNSKFVRGIKRVREQVEWFLLPRYEPKKIRDGYYELTFSYVDDKDLDDQIYDLIGEIHREADLHNCFAELDIIENGTDRSWS